MGFHQENSLETSQASCVTRTNPILDDENEDDAVGFTSEKQSVRWMRVWLDESEKRLGRYSLLPISARFCSNVSTFVLLDLLIKYLDGSSS